MAWYQFKVNAIDRMKYRRKMGKFEGKSIIVNNKTYTLTELIGQGGNAEVWKAENDYEKYAVKILINNQKKR